VAFEFAAGSPQFTSAYLTQYLASHANNDFKRPVRSHMADAEKALCDSVPLKPPNSVTLTKIKKINLFGRSPAKLRESALLKLNNDLRN